MGPAVAAAVLCSRAVVRDLRRHRRGPRLHRGAPRQEDRRGAGRGGAGRGLRGPQGREGAGHGLGVRPPPRRLLARGGCRGGAPGAAGGHRGAAPGGSGARGRVLRVLARGVRRAHRHGPRRLLVAVLRAVQHGARARAAGRGAGHSAEARGRLGAGRLVAARAEGALCSEGLQAQRRRGRGHRGRGGQESGRPHPLPGQGGGVRGGG
mmetsp:Transcript_24781/g.66216  ORF Transcript_24781/g.66216 Transcript_24781/m.66216 type:complete len:208 (+) Transcript_24781:213-836(+)